MSTPKLKRVHRLDSVRIEYTDEGFLIDKPIVTTIGIFEYQNPDGSTRRELRLPQHVFDKDSLASYKGKPVIITHDAGRVDKENIYDDDTYTVGTILTDGYKDGDNVRAEIVIHDIDEVKRTGLRELSLGYDLELDETPGTWKGQEYDAIQSDIRVNHLALVREARAGDHARLNIDSKNNNTKKEEGGHKMSKQTGGTGFAEKISNAMRSYRERQKRRLDEKSEDEAAEYTADTDSELESNDADYGLDKELDKDEDEPDTLQLVKDRRDRRDADGDPDTPETAMEVIAQQDEDIEKLIYLVEELQAKHDYAKEDKKCDEENEDAENEDEYSDKDKGGMDVTIHMDGNAVDRIVSERLALARIGDKLRLDGLEKLQPLEAKKAIIKKVNPQMRLDGKSKAYINAAYDLAVDQVGRKDAAHQRRQMASRADGVPTGTTSANRARERMMQRQQNGGKE